MYIPGADWLSGYELVVAKGGGGGGGLLSPITQLVARSYSTAGLCIELTYETIPCCLESRVVLLTSAD